MYVLPEQKREHWVDKSTPFWIILADSTRKCYLPVMQKDETLKMMRVYNLDDLKSLVPNKWQILEPPPFYKDSSDTVIPRENGTWMNWYSIARTIVEVGTPLTLLSSIGELWNWSFDCTRYFFLGNWVTGKQLDEFLITILTPQQVLPLMPRGDVWDTEKGSSSHSASFILRLSHPSFIQVLR